MGGEFTYQPKWDPKTVLTTSAMCSPAFPKLLEAKKAFCQDFDVIMKKLGDEALGFTTKVKVPLDVVFAEMP